MTDDWGTPRDDPQSTQFFEFLQEGNLKKCHEMIDSSSINARAGFTTLALNVKPDGQHLALLRRLVNLMSDEDLDDHDEDYMNYSVLGYLIDVINQYPNWREFIELALELIQSHDVNFYYLRRFATNPCDPVTQTELDIIDEISEVMEVEDDEDKLLEMNTYAHICQHAEIREAMYRKQPLLRFALNARNERPQQ